MRESDYSIEQTAAHFAARLLRLADTQQHDGRLKLQERVVLDSIRAFLDRIADGGVA